MIRSRKRIVPLLLCALCVLCGSLFSGEAAVATPPAEAPLIAAPVTLFDRIVELNRSVQEPELDPAKLRDEFSKLIERAKTALVDKTTPEQKIAALNAVLLSDRKVEYLSNKYWRDSTLAASVLRGKGNCLSTSTLYVLAGQALGLPIKMVLIPRHAFARWDDGTTRINIETTSGGKCYPDSEYLSRWSQPGADDIEWLGWCKSLDENSVYAELLLTSAGHRVGESKLDEALKLMDQAIVNLPNRSDIALRRCALMAEITGRRDEARAQVLLMLYDQKEHPLPASVETEALMYLARDAAGESDHQRERYYLMAAFARAPKSEQLHVLSSLAFCHRALKDYQGAVRYMELAVMLDPQSDSTLYNLAILQKNAGRLADAIGTIRRARKINPESWNLHILEAGYLILNGERDEGMKLYDTLEKPRADEEFWDIMQAWFFAASAQRDKFYPQFEKALSQAHSTRILEWIDQDPDLDVYRNEEEFKAAVEKHRKRLLGEK